MSTKKKPITATKLDLQSAASGDNQSPQYSFWLVSPKNGNQLEIAIGVFPNQVPEQNKQHIQEAFDHMVDSIGFELSRFVVK